MDKRTLLEQNKKWDERFMKQALEVASYSKDPSTKVGCIITRGKYRISDGYNGFPPMIEDTAERLNDRTLRLGLTDHAERNGIDNTREDLHGCTIYVTAPPCSGCARAISKAGITRVVYQEGTVDFNERWSTDLAIANIIFNAYLVRREVFSYDKLY